MKIIVTGASGFIGRHLVQEIRRRNGDVLPVSRTPLPYPQSVQVESYADTPAGDVLVHLAENRDRALAAPQEAETIRRFDTLLAKGFGRVIYVSSALVYGDGSVRPHGVDEPPSVSDSYTRTKVTSEGRALAVGGLVARLGNVYGPGMAPQNVVSAILDQIPGEGPLRVRHDSPVRDFVSVKDVAEVLARLALQPARPGIYNIGSGAGVSVGELARLALVVAGEGHRPVTAELPLPRPSCIVLDIQSTVRELDWHPRRSLAEGIKESLLERSPPTKSA
jgi:nucleoside-diphosphate-sugar epimerase